MSRPRNLWSPIKGFADLWEGEYAIPNFVSRSVLFKLADGAMAVYSPGHGLLADFHNRFPDACVRFLVAPNRFHHMGLAAWQAAYPDAQVVAPAEIVNTIAKKSNTHVHDLAALKAALSDQQSIVEVPGTKQPEVWLTQTEAQGCCWVLCDAFFNLQRLPKPLLVKWFIKLGGSGPGLRISRLFKWLFLWDRKGYPAFVRAQMEQTPPTCLVVTHGAVIYDDNLPMLVEKALHERFG